VRERCKTEGGGAMPSKERRDAKETWCPGWHVGMLANAKLW